MSTERRGDWIQTATGRAFWPLDPRPEDVHIHDIAIALSNQCRFAGHVLHWYSVAEHSVRVSDLLTSSGQPPEVALWGLLHDAAEAYLVDIPRPLKVSTEMDGYRAAEEAVLEAIARWAGLPIPIPNVVHLVDDILLATEARDILVPARVQWTRDLPDPLPERIEPMQPSIARFHFIRRFRWLRSLISSNGKVAHA